MGGYGSGRWHSYTKQTTESSKRLEIKHYIKTLRELEKVELGKIGIVTANPSWNRSGQDCGNIGLRIEGRGSNVTATVNYQITKQSGEKQDYKYRVGMDNTPGLGDCLRWWWVCPKCGKRCGVLYMPPGASTFACRKCHNLTYTSCQESHKSNSMHKMLAAMMQDHYPGITPIEAGRVFEKDIIPRRFVEAAYNRLWQKHLVNLLKMAEQDPYPGYLTAAELCDLTRLTPDELQELEAARLLIPDRPSGRYRPKLKGWAAKLAYLLRDGWTIAELRSWSKGRWKSPNPRQFPPERAAWQE